MHRVAPGDGLERQTPHGHQSKARQGIDDRNRFGTWDVRRTLPRTEDAVPAPQGPRALAATGAGASGGWVRLLAPLVLRHYSALSGRRWQDPVFPVNFPWVGSSDYWGGQVDMLIEQNEAMQEEPLQA